MADRSFQLILKQTGTNKKVTVNVVQTKFVPVYTFSTTDNSYSVPHGGGSKAFTITSTKTTVSGDTATVAYTATVASTLTGYVTVSGNIITVKANDTYTAKSGTVTFKQNESGKTFVVNVTLAKKPDDIVFSVSPTVLNFAPQASNKSLTVTSTHNGANRAWEIDTTAGALPAWLKVEGAMTGGTNTVKVTVTDNP